MGDKFKILRPFEKAVEEKKPIVESLHLTPEMVQAFLKEQVDQTACFDMIADRFPVPPRVIHGILFKSGMFDSIYDKASQTWIWGLS